MATSPRHNRLRTCPLPLALAVFLLALPSPGSAQTVATTFEELLPLVKTGDTLQVTDATGRKSSGRLGKLSPSSLELLIRKTSPDGRETFVPQSPMTEREVREVRVVRRDSLLNGTLIGLAVGAGPFLLAWPSLRGAETEYAAPLGALFGGGIGACAGAAVDAFRIERTTVYERSPAQRSSGLQVSPVLLKSAVGFQVSVRLP